MKVRGYTLIEFMIAIAIIVIVSALIVPYFDGRTDRQENTSVQSGFSIEPKFTNDNADVGVDATKCTIVGENDGGKIVAKCEGNKLIEIQR